MQALYLSRVSLCLIALGGVCARPLGAAEPLLVFAGAASKPPTEEAATRFEELTGTNVQLVFGGSGYVLSQMKLTKHGDIYFPGSSDYMEQAKRDGVVYPDTEQIIVYLVPAITVQKGNPKGIRGLKDLTRPGVTVAIANPEGVCVGAYAVEIIERHFTPAEQAAFRSNLINYTESCEKTATAIALKMADAVIGWSVFEHWDPARIETVPLPAGVIPRIGYISVAIAKYTRDRGAAQAFIDFLRGPEGRRIYAKHHYFASADEAAAYLGAVKPVGGEYQVPPAWIQK